MINALLAVSAWMKPPPVKAPVGVVLKLGCKGAVVVLGAAAAVRSEGAVHSHVRRALEAGVTPEQIHHTLLSLTSTIGFPTVIAALSWADDVIGRAEPAV